jgi:hypothetical protein
MTSKSRTIDNLGLDASVRYAQDQKLFEAQFIEDSQIVARKSEIPVFRPYAPSDFDLIFGTGKTTMWASLPTPPKMATAMHSLFSYSLIPSLKMDEDHQDLEEALQGAFDHQREQNPDSSDEEKEEEEKEKEILIAFVQCVAKINQSLQLINSRRNQYQRG